MAASTKLIVLRRLLGRTLKPPAASSSSSSISRNFLSPLYLLEASNGSTSRPLLSTVSRRSFCSFPSSLHDDVSQGPVAVDYRYAISLCIFLNPMYSQFFPFINQTGSENCISGMILLCFNC